MRNDHHHYRSLAVLDLSHMPPTADPQMTTDPDPDPIEQHPGTLIDWDTFTEEMLRKIQG